MACSAVVMALPNGVFMTTTPCAVAALMSTLSTADAGAAHDLQLLGLGQHFGRDLGGGADRQAVVVGNDGAQLGGLQARLEVDVAAALREDLDGALGQLIGNENFRLGHEWLL